MSNIKIKKLNEVFFGIACEEPGIHMELKEHYSFYAPNYKFAPLYKSKRWDGKIHLYNLNTRRLYIGLFWNFFQFCEEHNYKIEIEDNPFYGNLKNTIIPSEIDDEDIKILDSIKFKYDSLRDFQMESIVEGLKHKRRTFILPTGSGKSAVLYYFALWYSLKQQNEKKVLIVVPNVSLVEQMTKDFMDYAKNTLNVDMIRKIYSGKDKNIDSPITISTYQSLQNIEDNSFYREFGMIMVDEAHGATAKVLTSVIEKCTEAEYRFGFTGSLRDSVLNDLQLTGLLGPIKKSISTKELQDRKELSDLSIDCVVLKYPEAIRKEFNKGKPNYQNEIDYVLESTNRNNFICNLAFEQKGTTLVLFNYVEKHGVPMFKIAQEKNKKHGRNIFFVSGSTHVDDREKIREIVEKEKDCIIFASSGTFSQGINIPSIENLIFTFSTKSFIRIIQSIGRALRMSEAKNKAKVYDIIDNISWKSKKNYGMKHAITRISFYEQEKFKYKIREIPFKPS